MLIRALDNLSFLLFLVLLIIITLPFGSYDGFYWSGFGFLASLLLALVILLNVLKKRSVPSAVRSAKTVLILMLLQITYVAAQAKLGFTGREVMPLLAHGQPDWFSPITSLSIVSSNMANWLGKYILGVIFFLLSLFLVKTRWRIKAVIICIISCALLHGVIAFAANYFNTHLVPLQSIDGHFDISRGLFVNRNHFAAMANYGLAMLMIGGFYYFYNTLGARTSLRTKAVLMIDFILSSQLLWLFALVILVVSMNLSSSRAAVLGMLGATVLVSIFAVMADKQLRKAIGWLIAILAFLIILLIFSSGESGIVTRIKEGGFTIGERQQQWALTLAIFQKFWLFGSGVGTYAEAFQYFRGHDDSLRQVVYDQSHSLYLQNLLEQGTVGFVIWMSSLLMVFRNLIIGFFDQKSSYIKSVILGVLIALITALLQSGVDFNLLIPALNVYFYVIIALGYAALSVYSESSSQKIEKTQSEVK